MSPALAIFILMYAGAMVDGSWAKVVDDFRLRGIKKYEA